MCIGLCILLLGLVFATHGILKKSMDRADTWKYDKISSGRTGLFASFMFAQSGNIADATVIL